MSRRPGRRPAARWAVFALCLVPGPAFNAAQAPPAVIELANYRLTEPAFERFRRASDLVADARAEAGPDAEPLVTRELAVSGDAVAAADALESRLQREPAFVIALGRAGLPPREFARFAIALMAARVAHGLIQEKILESVRAGVPADNVAFVAVRAADVDRVLAVLGVHDAVRAPAAGGGAQR